MSRTIEIERIPTGKPEEFYVVSMMHSKGQKTYFLNVVPIRFEQCDGYMVKHFGLFTGRNMTVAVGVKRFSQQRLQAHADAAKGTYDHIIAELRAEREAA